MIEAFAAVAAVLVAAIALYVYHPLEKRLSRRRGQRSRRNESALEREAKAAALKLGQQHQRPAIRRNGVDVAKEGRSTGG
jgi:hypothetical protein